MHLFTWYDGIRSIIRPGSPAVLMTLFLLIAGGVMGIFFAITLTFTERLSVDRDSSTNIYAINILETDEQKVRSTFPEADVFSILRARVVRINDRSLADHIGTPTPGGEFRREFSITTNPLKDVPLLEGKSEIGEKEVSVEE